MTIETTFWDTISTPELNQNYRSAISDTSKVLAPTTDDLSISDTAFRNQNLSSSILSGVSVGMSLGGPIGASVGAGVAVLSGLMGRSGRKNAKAVEAERQKKQQEQLTKQWKQQLKQYKSKVKAFAKSVGGRKQATERKLYGGLADLTSQALRDQSAYFGMAGGGSTSGGVATTRQKTAKANVVALDTLADIQETRLVRRIKAYQNVQRFAKEEISAPRSRFEIQTVAGDYMQDTLDELDKEEGLYG